MISHYGRKIVQICSAPQVRQGEVFCDPLSSSLKLLDTIIPPVDYPKGAILFMEGQAALGIFALYSGQVKLSRPLPKGR